MIQVAAYIRVSTDGQCGEDKFGLEAQKQQIIDFCNEKDWLVTQWFTDEGESGAKERPGFDEIIYGGVENPPFQYVVVAKSDRVARDIQIYYYYKMMLRKKGIELVSVAEDFGSFGAFKDMLEAFTLCVAQMERENITKRTAGGRAIKAKSGGYSGGRTPLGYNASDGKLIVNEEEADAVRLIFKLNESKTSMNKIADCLNNVGYKSKSGGKFFASTVKQILENERTYRGEYRYGKEGEWVKGQHEPILTD